MFSPKEDMKEIYENIAVIAIYMPNAEEIPFEVNKSGLLQQYQNVLSECTEMLYHDNNCWDVIVQNNHIFCVFDGRCDEAIQRVIMIAEQILGQKQQIESGMECWAEKLIFGVGVAAGGAVMLQVNNAFHTREKKVWLGQVFSNAYSMAQMAVCDGRRKVWIAGSE